jgi:competence protein ComEC
MFILFTLAFLLADLFVQTRASLFSALLVMVVLSLVLWIMRKNRGPFFYMILAFVFGMAWTTWYAYSLLAWQLPRGCEGTPLLVTGYIASLPEKDQWQQRFVFSMQNLRCQHYFNAHSTHIRLSWRNNNMPLHVGDEWQLLVKLKRIHSTQNPGAFDFEAWALQKGLRANGYVITNKDNKLIAQHRFLYPINHVREILQERILAQLPHSKTAPWLLALMIGERNNIASEDWQVLRNTGTNHLMAIAGLHIGMLAGFVHMLVSWLWRRFPSLLLHVPANQAGASVALMVAIIYSALAGFSLPTERACLMLLVFSAALLSRKKLNPWHVWSLALLVVLLFNPLSVLAESFWLSFCTIALIIYGMRGRLAPQGIWWHWGRVQWVIGFGLIPISLALFHECSLVSFVANSIAIPWLGFLILPFCLLADLDILISPNMAAWLLWLADKSLTGLWVVLSWFSKQDFSIWLQVIPNHFILFVSVIAVLLLLLPAGLPGRWLGIVWILPLLFFRFDKPKQGDVWLSLLDVGQGLAVVVQTKTHLLVYDAGPKFNENFDMGESVVLPYLHTQGIKKIDMLVVSHGDNDHIGGAAALQRALPIAALRTSVPDKLPSPQTTYCLAGMSWEWDQVRFSFLYPTLEDIDQGNDSSCVLLIEQHTQRILLTGDIEKLAETNLLSRVPEKLSADILIAPHHGSKTSGQKKFIYAVHPAYVLYATGYRNRYRFPHQSVVDTYEEIGSKQLETAKSGAIIFKLSRVIKEPALYRITNKRYWFDG